MPEGAVESCVMFVESLEILADAFMPESNEISSLIQDLRRFAANPKGPAKGLAPPGMGPLVSSAGSGLVAQW